MNISIVWILLLVAVVAVTAQVKPKIPETFEAHVLFTVIEKDKEQYNGQGVHAAHEANGYNLEIFHFERDSHLEVYRLQRFDLGFQYELDNVNRSTCSKTRLSGTMPANWGWVAQAEYGGKVQFNERVLELWRFTEGFSDVELSVDPVAPNVPVVVRRNSSNTDVVTHFVTFTPLPSDNIFDIPRQCNNTVVLPTETNITTAACRARATMISVGQSWVNAKVPYNQGATYDGYREDCSGFVSACWAESKPGPTTQQFHTFTKVISKNELEEGDCLLYAAEHVVLFGGWANSAKTEYTAYEETKPGEGTVKRVTPYPYWYSQSSFIPNRYNNAC